MIYITQLVYVVPGKEEAFQQFEEVAIPVISKYNGRMLLRVRPEQGAFVQYQIERPYEIHIVEFDAQADFEAFTQDEERKRFLHLKAESVKASIMYKGVKL